MPAIDLIPDGLPPEVPEASADTAYTGIPAPLGSFLGTQGLSTVRQVGRVAEQGAYEGSGWLPQVLYNFGRYANEDESLAATLPEAVGPASGTTPAPILSPDEYNSKFAPLGDDGKPVSLGDKPMPEPIARLIGDAKREEIERENIASRFEDAHSWPVNFAAGTLGFLLDPLRASTAFIPGIGEEALTARLGTGLIARTLARLGAGAAGGAAAQAPLSALEYGLGQEEASDYGLRDAFRDMAFGAAGNAIFHAGFGALGDLARWRRGVAVPGGELAPELPQAAPIIEADATTQHAAMGPAVSQLADGRPIDVEPFFYRPPQADTAVGLAMREPGPAQIVAEPTVEAQARRQAPDLFAQRDRLMDEAAQHRQTLDDPARAIDQRIAAAQEALKEADTTANVLPTDVSADQLRTLMAQRGAARDAAAREVDSLQASRQADIDNAVAAARDRLVAIDLDLRDMAPRLTTAMDQARTVMGVATASRATVMGLQPRIPDPAAVVAGQRQLYRDGFVSGVPGDELRSTMQAVYGPERTVEAAATRADSAPGAPEAETRPGAATLAETETRAPRTPERAAGHAGQREMGEGLRANPEIAEAERRLAAIGGDLLPEERADLDASEEAMRAADQRAAAVHEAAACLAEAGL